MLNCIYSTTEMERNVRYAAYRKGKTLKQMLLHRP